MTTLNVAGARCAATLTRSSANLPVDHIETVATMRAAGILNDAAWDSSLVASMTSPHVVALVGDPVAEEDAAPVLLEYHWIAENFAGEATVSVYSNITDIACGVRWQIRSGKVIYSFAPTITTPDQIGPHNAVATVTIPAHENLVYELWWRPTIGGAIAGDFQKVVGASITIPAPDGPPIEG